VSTVDTARGLRLIAQCLDGLPGLPDVYVTVSATSISVQVVKSSGTAEQSRRNAVDVLLAVLSGSVATVQPYLPPDVGASYTGYGALGEFTVQVFTGLDRVRGAGMSGLHALPQVTP
jgi:hypothetical protein